MTTQYVLLSSITGVVAAQLLKPVCYYFIHHRWKFILMLSSGKMPSSHSSLVTALSCAVGLTDGFQSTTFIICVVLSLIICYDAANVRYYAGQNIAITKKLVDDLSALGSLKPDDPIYHKKMKDVLGHTYTEVLGGIIVGLISALSLYYILGGK